MNAKRARQVISETSGRWFTVDFTKRTNGELRTINGRIDAKKYVKGNYYNFEPRNYNLYPVYVASLDEYRLIPLEGVKSIRANKRVYK